MNRKHYHTGCLKVLRVLSEVYENEASIGYIAAHVGLSESGAAARFRQLRRRPYNCVMECTQMRTLPGVWRYRLVHAPKHLLRLAREMQQ